MWKNKSKYGNVKIDFDGHSFGSKLEAAVYQILKLRLAAKEIKEIECQVQIDICGPLGHVCDHRKRIYYKADFKCTRPDDSFFYVEAKGFETDAWAIKLRLIRHHLGVPLEIWRGTAARPFLDETVIPS